MLAIAAAKLGFGPVTAVDNEPAALEATRANARANGVELDRVERVDLRERAAAGAPTRSPPTWCARCCCAWPSCWRARPRALIVSGLLDEEADEVAAAFAPLRERRRLVGAGLERAAALR